MSNITVTGTLTDRPVAAQTINFRRVAQIPTGWSADPVTFSAVSDVSGTWSVSLPTNRTGDEYWVARVAGSSAETWFYLSPTAASPSTIDAVEVKALTDLPDVAPDDAGGTVDTSGLLPIADPTGVTIETTPNTIKGSGTVNVVTVPADTTVFAVKLEGDDFPRVVVNADPTDWGAIQLGDGTFDPLTGGANIYYAAEGLWLTSGGSKAVNFNSDIAWPSSGGGPVLQDNGDGLFYRATLANGVLTWVLVT